MVQRLTASQIGPVIDDLASQGMLDYRIPEPVSGEALTAFCTTVAQAEGGRCYGWFGKNLRPKGLFVGLIAPDPLTGGLCGFEVAWWSKLSRAALGLLREFEYDCQAVGCSKVLLGYSQFAMPERRRELYARLGYADHSAVMFKEL